MKYVGYTRVSTRKQGDSGLGEEAQVAALSSFVRARGGELIEIYREVESGRVRNRPVLNQAMCRAKEEDAVLLIAKLDRLARNVLFTAQLQESRVRFTACDMPDATEFTINILAAMAQQEAVMASIRTREALTQAKARGVQLGNPKLRDKTWHKENVAARVEAQKRYAHERSSDARAYLKKIVAMKPGVSVREATRMLQASQIRPPRSLKWDVAAVWRLMRKEGLVSNQKTPSGDAA